MRYEEATWLIAFVEEYGVGLERGELAEIQEAEVRVYGPAILPGVTIPKIDGNVPVKKVHPWEADIIAGIAHELAAALVVEGEEDEDGR